MDDFLSPVSSDAECLLIPGWHGSGAGHWQAAWAKQQKFTLVDQADWEWPRRGDWTTRLEDVVSSTSGSIILIAHSLGCHLLAHWATLSQQLSRVKAALLVAPPDLGRAELPPQLSPWRSGQAAAANRLPFPSLVLASSDDPYSSVAQARQSAASWGAEFRDLGPLGHINSESGLGEWRQGLLILQDFLSRRSPSTES